MLRIGICIETALGKNKIVLIAIAVAAISSIVALNANNANRAVGSVPVLLDDSLTVELVAEGLELPTSMRFLDASNILVLQKNDGQIRLVSDGKLQPQPVLQVDVESRVEQGLLGIAVFDKEVFLYFTELADNTTRNRVYKYGWTGENLVGGRLILDLPGEPGPYHNGGKIAVGPDGYLYAVIGDLNAGGGMLDNQIPGRPADDKSVILRVDRQTGLPAQDNPYHQDGLEKYYAYGIRNSFGMDFDPVTNTLWITENGPDKYDEINVVNPGFNSGWHKVTGPISRTNVTIENDLHVFDGARYGDPAFSWYAPVGVTDIEFFDSPKLGDRYQNNIFVGDINYGTLHFFEVNQDRTGLEFSDQRLLDLVADPVQEGEPEASSAIIGQGFGRITDIETGPDGYLYVLTYEDGKLYRIAAKQT